MKPEHLPKAFPLTTVMNPCRFLSVLCLLSATWIIPSGAAMTSNGTGVRFANAYFSSISLNDLANTATITNAAMVGSVGIGTIGNLIDGDGAMNSNGSVFFSYSSHGFFLPNTQTITFDTSQNTLGYKINTIATYAGWTSDGAELANQSYFLSYSTVAAPSTYLMLGSVNYAPFGDGNGSDGWAGSTAVTVGDAAQGFLATNVKSLKIQFNPTNNLSGTNGTIYQEIDVFGTAVPEPSAAQLCSLSTLALLRRRR